MSEHKMIRKLEKTSWGAESNGTHLSGVFWLGGKDPVFVRRKKVYVFRVFVCSSSFLRKKYGKIYIT